MWIEVEIEHIEGPCAGTKKIFGGNQQQIIFGRDGSSDICFPPEARIVGRMHMQLVRQISGDYVAEVFGDRYVTVDGRYVKGRQPVPDGAEIQIGDASGPLLRFRVRRQSDLKDVWATLTQGARHTTGNLIAAVQRRQRMTVAAFSICTIALAVGIWHLNTRITTVDAKIDSTRLAAKEEISGDSGRLLLDAAHAVIVRGPNRQDRLIGTAWPVRDRLAVTNAHVAAEPLEPGERLILRRPGGMQDYEIQSVDFHPAYEEFQIYLEQRSAQSGGFRAANLEKELPKAYDVAILEIGGEEVLSPVLDLADPAELEALSPGSALAYAGYPTKGIAGQSHAPLAVVPQLQYGRVTALTDVFLFFDDPDRTVVVHNSIPAIPGASGSPIIDRSGKVVAIVNAGSTALINYAQRVDLVDSILPAAGKFDVEAETAVWDQKAKRFDRHEETVVAQVHEDLSATRGTATELARGRYDFSDNPCNDSGPLRCEEHQLRVNAGRSYVFLAYGVPGTPLNLLLEAENRTELGGTTGWFSKLAFEPEEDGLAVVRVLASSSGTNAYSWYVFASGNQ